MMLRGDSNKTKSIRFELSQQFEKDTFDEQSDEDSVPTSNKMLLSKYHSQMIVLGPCRIQKTLLSIMSTIFSKKGYAALAYRKLYKYIRNTRKRQKHMSCRQQRCTKAYYFSGPELSNDACLDMRT